MAKLEILTFIEIRDVREFQKFVIPRQSLTGSSNED